ncbi:carbohydrate-binding module family 50 protein, partial [Lentithecium fluviatile CBS 122367]
CDKTYKVHTGDTCNTIVQKNPGLTLENLYKWNWINNPACDNLRPRCNYCVHKPIPDTVPEPHQPNIKMDCKEYYQAVSGDYCWLLCQQKGVDLNSFLSWNPDVGVDCQSMLAGYYYCLRI